MKNKFLLVAIVIASILIMVSVSILIEIFNQGSNNNEGLNTVDIQKLPIPLLLEDKNPKSDVSDFYLNVQYGYTNFFADVSTPTMGYNTNYLGPVMKVTKGQLVNMFVNNQLDESTSIHWHGLEVPGSEDGGPHQKIESDADWNPSFTIDQPASTLWFHPHVIGTTATQVYYGLAGLIIVEDENSTSLILPDEYGVNDIPLIIQDRSFNQDGTFLYDDNMSDGAFGDYILVNGAITPYLDVNQIKMRFRVVNGANALNFNLKLSDNSSYYQIASDGGLLENPLEMDELFLSPGERAEIIIDFSKYDEGDKVELRTNNEVVMTFNIKDKIEDNSVIPETLSVIERLDESKVSRIKTIVLDGMGHMVKLNGKKFDINRIDDNVKQNDIEIWEISATNRMMMGSHGHPFHIHGTQFQVLSRNNQEPYANEMGWKDTIFIDAGETVRIIVEFKHKGIFMYHCHILEHEEAGMMGQLEVY